MTTTIRRVPRLFTAAALAVGATALTVIAVPAAAFAVPTAAEAPTIGIGDGSVVASDSSLASVPITYRCEADTVASIVVKLRQPLGDYGFVDGVTRHTVPCTGESVTTTITIASLHGDSWQAGRATGELSIFGGDRATAHQPFAITLSE